MDVPESVFSPETPDKQRQMSDNSVRVASPRTRSRAETGAYPAYRRLLAMQKVVGSNPISRFREGLLLQAFFVRGWCDKTPTARRSSQCEPPNL